jgi:hypothetical protein
MHLKVFSILETGKTVKTLSSGQINKKNIEKPKKNQKKKKPKKHTGLGLKKKRVFSNPVSDTSIFTIAVCAVLHISINIHMRDFSYNSFILLYKKLPRGSAGSCLLMFSK